MYVVPFFNTIYEFLGVFAGDAVGVAFATGFNHIGVVAHAAFQTFDDDSVLRMHQGIDSGDYVFFYIHFLDTIGTIDG